LEDGYEGLMFRNTEGIYKFKHRSSDLLKIKRFTDSEFEIIGSKDGTGREEGLIIFRCKNESGKEFDVRPAGSMEERAKMWQKKDSFVGKLLKVKYQEFTDDGLPRFPVGLHIREEWDR
jgi:DNA ligase-1